MSPEERLWVSVICQMIADAHLSSWIAQEDRDRARAWLPRQGHDRSLVCLLAGIDPGFLDRLVEPMKKAWNE